MWIAGGRAGDQELENIQPSKGKGIKLASEVKSGSGVKEVDTQGAKDRRTRLDTLLNSKTETKRKELEEKKVEKANPAGVSNPPANEFYEDGSNYSSDGGDEPPTEIRNTKHPKGR